jgi:mRNA interferase HicA
VVGKIAMKKKDLERQLRKLGWYFLRHGGNHDIWSNGDAIEQIPRHNELDYYLAKKILNTAEHNRRKNS